MKSTTWPCSQPIDHVAERAAEDQRQADREQRCVARGSRRSHSIMRHG